MATAVAVILGWVGIEEWDAGAIEDSLARVVDGLLSAMLPEPGEPAIGTA